ncbi:hypothetical protein [Streptomyces sp. NPDC017529]|uniref:imine reductase family protein n=1 Tax=Streptomyces sp. NPDC017529 TaxID=3365000 RepID=UPI003797BCBE
MSAVYDLAMLSFFHSGMAGLAHAFTLAGAEGVTAKDLMGHLGVIVEIFPAIAEGMAAGHGGAEFVRTTETRRAPAV